MFLKAAKIEHQGLHDPSLGLLERPGLDSGLGFQAPGMLLKAAKIVQQGYHRRVRTDTRFCIIASAVFSLRVPLPISDGNTH